MSTDQEGDEGSGSLPRSSKTLSKLGFLRTPKTQRLEAGSQDGDVAPPPLESETLDQVGLRGRIYGSPTTFGSVPWWSEKNWWKLPPSGEANDIRCQVGTVGDLALAGASIRGNKHRLHGSVNEDSFATAHVQLDDDTSFLVVALCDGMGSASQASFGARLAAQNVTRAIAALIEHRGGATLRSFEAEQERLLNAVTTSVLGFRVEEFGAPEDFVARSVDAFQCTLTFAVIPATASLRSRHAAVLGFVGDSPAFLLRSDRIRAIEPAKDHDGLWSSASAGLLGASSMLLTEVALLAGDGLLITSDGIGNFLLYQGAPTLLGRDLATRWSQPVEMLDFVRDLSFELQSADDDRTAVMVWVDR